MSEKVTNYKCPSCGGPIRYDPSTKILTCDYCNSVFSVEEIENQYKEKDEKAASSEETSWTSSSNNWNDTENLKVYSCPSCRAELICDQSTVATFCPYCSNNVLVPGELSGFLKPEYIIPFAKNKNEALQSLKDFYKNKKLLPRNFSSKNQMQKIQGIYVPFWLFDGVANAVMDYKATKTHINVMGNEQVTTTEHYQLHREGSLEFERIPVDASSKMPDEYMDALEPFDYSGLKSFSNAYLPGFFANRYDVEIEDCAYRAETRAIQTTADEMRQTTGGYDTVLETNRNIKLVKKNVSYVLLPVWMLYTSYLGKNYLFAMNGQTGKIVGELPVDKGKAFGYFVLIMLLVAVLFMAFVLLAGGYVG